MSPHPHEHDPSFALAAELRLAMTALVRRLRDKAHLADDLTWAQSRVLSRLEADGPATVTQLAKAEGMRSQSMGEVVAGLKNGGLVSGEPDPNDGRQTVLSLTPLCRDKLAATRAARQDLLYQAIQAKLSVEEQRELAHAVGLLKRLVDLDEGRP
ncbi:MarR family winged helix-turn-helix transcriptional regulator [Chitinimonas sp.]|uniref:MarR family winged helix-turn-helix transcriptional regulator n=1 Tax=Chitinimonas sp. TaxID=1934313 RepID=UPI002F93DE84